jgi:O-6-methylguanine DNA methyltransferase
MESNLQHLRDAHAPAGFARRVLHAVGLADQFAPLDSPLGRVFVAWNRRGISAVMRVASEAAFRDAFERSNGRSLERARDIPVTLRRTLESGDSADARRLRYDLRSCSEFETAVLRKALEIPRGQVRPYAWIAREIGRPKAVRAVGTALANNPVPILIPCHRVVRGDGKIGNYALGGSQKKERILLAEGVEVGDLEQYAREGMRLRGVSSTKIFCWPTCAAGRRAKPQNVRPFRTENAARAAGYRPCKVCRPAAA